jgi:sterol O-acyltransferase
MGTALMLIKVAADNWRRYGSIFGRNEIVRLMLSRDVLVLGITDGVLCGVTGVSLLIQKLVFSGYISWTGSGWIIQNVWQCLFLGAFIGFTFIRHWPWTHSVFITLHTITMLMKQHSYAFYNGYLSDVYKKKVVLEQKLKQLNDSELASPESPRAYATSYMDAADLNVLSHRRKSNPAVLEDAHKDISSIAYAIEADAPLSFDQARSLRKLIAWEIEAFDDELKGTCKTTSNHYPSNLTLRGFYGYIPLPTVVYELEYPRQESVNWFYVAEKTTATFGVIGVMIVVSTAYIYPVCQSIVQMKEDGIPLKERLKEFPWAFSDLLFPFMMEYLLSWYVIWECVVSHSLMYSPRDTPYSWIFLLKRGLPLCFLISSMKDPPSGLTAHDSSMFLLNSHFLPIVGSMEIGGTVPPGTNSLVIGIVPYTTSFCALLTIHQSRLFGSHGRLPLFLRSFLAPVYMSS